MEVGQSVNLSFAAFDSDNGDPDPIGNLIAEIREENERHRHGVTVDTRDRLMRAASDCLCRWAREIEVKGRILQNGLFDADPDPDAVRVIAPFTGRRYAVPS